MDLVDKYLEEINAIRELIKPIVDEYYPSKANRETISLYDLITDSCSPALQRSYKARLRSLHRRSQTFPENSIQQAKRLNRYEELLYRVLNFVFEKVSEGEIKIVDAKPVETKELVRFNYKKRGESSIIMEEESIGYNPSKKDSTAGIR